MDRKLKIRKDELTRKQKWGQKTEIPTLPTNKVPVPNSGLIDFTEVEEGSDTEPEDEEEALTAPVLRKYSSRRTITGGSVRRSQRIAGKQPQYMGLFCHIEGK